MNFSRKESELIATANEVKNIEETDKELVKAKQSTFVDSSYEKLVREALYEKLYGYKRNNKSVEKLITVLLATEIPSYVILAKQLESIQRSQYLEDMKQIDAMMIARKGVSYGASSSKKTILTTYKEYNEAKQKSFKYNKEFIKKAKKCKCVREILDDAEFIIMSMERKIPSLANSYSWNNDVRFNKYAVEGILRKNMDSIENFLSNSELINKYLSSKESRVKLKY